MNASFFIRLKAFMYDYIVMFVYLLFLFFINVFLFPSLQNFFSGSLITAQLTGFIMVTLPISIYFIISDSKMAGQSFGKKRANIRVVGPNGEAASVLRITCRTILKFLPWELSHFLVYRLVTIGDGVVPIAYYFIGGLIYLLMFIYIGTAIFTKKKQSLYDKLTKTYVIKV
ncbi:RDD family protein [Alkalicoccobacillus murimartini]|uniref:RDD family membrane protein YckC n=1 Tax=Alkalicoccobacillus murimartini TaxID=171685 RepID=A0ABT9YF39_9BACI|nr:RDD family protein [Alkalicoccobacillus murimartini]MDQ0205827.1 putative RDD family membrane protein YckC [Alkalicoccobacillus murimartini]